MEIWEHTEATIALKLQRREPDRKNHRFAEKLRSQQVQIGQTGYEYIPAENAQRSSDECATFERRMCNVRAPNSNVQVTRPLIRRTAHWPRPTCRSGRGRRADSRCCWSGTNCCWSGTNHVYCRAGKSCDDIWYLSIDTLIWCARSLSHTMAYTYRIRAQIPQLRARQSTNSALRWLGTVVTSHTGSNRQAYTPVMSMLQKAVQSTHCTSCNQPAHTTVLSGAEERGVEGPSLDRSYFSRLQPISFLFFNPS